MIVGFGWDVHPLVERGRLVLGGVSVSESLGVVAHSDGDVLCHALIDAISGVIFGKDLGELYPDTDENKNMNSLEALSETVKKIKSMGYHVVSADSTVVIAGIRLSNRREEILKNLRIALSCERVSVKFKSGNGVGDVGRGKAVEAFAVVLLEAIE